MTEEDSPAGGRKLQRRSVETRERLLEAAIDLFAERGFDGATTRAIVKRAGVALAALPYHFKTKDALWRAAADQIFGQYRERMTGRLHELGGEDDVTRTKQLLRELVLFAADCPQAYRFILQESTQRSARMEWLVETHIRPTYEYVIASVEHAQKHGFGRKGRPSQLYYMMLGAAATLYSLAPEFEMLTGESATREDLVEAHIESVLDVFYRSDYGSDAEESDAEAATSAPNHAALAEEDESGAR